MTRQASPFRIPFRRRREGKTNYYRRLGLVKSGKPRLVVRRTLNRIIVQLVEAQPRGDKVRITASSKELLRDYGWKASGDNMPAAYLTGLLAGFKAKKSGLDEAVLDVGVLKPPKGSRIYAALQGALDAGLRVPCDESVFPSQARIRGEHIAKYCEALEGEARRRVFSQYFGRGLEPERLPQHFEEAREKILRAFRA